jgi:hypothetical protein
MDCTGHISTCAFVTEKYRSRNKINFGLVRNWTPIVQARLRILLADGLIIDKNRQIYYYIIRKTSSTFKVSSHHWRLIFHKIFRMFAFICFNRLAWSWIIRSKHVGTGNVAGFSNNNGFVWRYVSTIYQYRYHNGMWNIKVITAVKTKSTVLWDVKLPRLDSTVLDKWATSICHSVG